MKTKKENLRTPMTIKDLKNKYPQIKNYYKNELLKDILNLSQTELLLSENNQVIEEYQQEYENKIKRLQQNEPIQYLTNKAYFLNEEYYVDKRVLIPRPETEYLVMKTLELIEQYQIKSQVLEIGTGSGIIAISLKKKNPNLNITATDISKEALEVANINKNHHQVEINFQNKDLLTDIVNKYDILISNPPYIKNNSPFVEEQVKKYEPNIALYGGKDGLDFYRKILKEAPKVLNKKNLIAFEIGEDQSLEIERLAKKYYPHSKVIKMQDLNKFDRYIFIINE